MKKFIAALLVTTVTFFSVQAQTKQQVNQLTTLAKVWGFLKYYHPEVAKGNPDWDSALLRMIPLAKSASSPAAFNQLITDWYHSLPKAVLSATITQLKSDTIERTFDETAIRHFNIPAPLKEELTRLYLYHLPDSGRYISDHYNQYHLDYVRHIEEPFDTPALPDEEHRLLGLFRYWNIIDYFYPYKKINAPDWQQVLPDFIPRFIAAVDTTAYRKTFLTLTAQLKDSHSFFSQQQWNASHYRMTLPFDVACIDGKYYIRASRYDSLMKVLDFTIGDEITGINGRPVMERVHDLEPITTGTNKPSVYHNIAYMLFRIDTNRVMKIDLLRAGKPVQKTVQLFTGKELAKIKPDARHLWEDMGNGIWYVRFCDITKPDTLRQLFTDLQRARAVIWEMRGYPSFPVVQAMGPGLFDTIRNTTISYNSLVQFPGALSVHNNAPAYTPANNLQLTLYKGPMIVLVNEQTQSLSESVAYELRFRSNTTIMGSQTAGTTGNITWVEYPGGISASFTGVGVKGLNESFTESKGVKIDKEITLTAEHLLNYKDYMLEMAYREAMKKQ